MDNEVSITFVFHAMGDDPAEALQRCLDYFEPGSSHSVEPQELYVSVKPR